MDVSHLLDGLNEPQRKAVAAEEGPLLVLAGAGSGKTRVLTHRVAWLVQAYSYSPLSILAVTFTNKAASEMRGRIEQMLGFPVGGMWMGTFHGLSHRMLRTHWQEAGLLQNFQIIDSDDQLRVVKRVIANMELDDSYWQPKQGQHFINHHKEAGRRAGDVYSGLDPQQQQWAKVYREYEVHCQRSGLVDFAELLLRTWEMMHNNEVLRLQYRERFRAVLVDEFQDTNSIQYRWLKEFVGPQSHIMVVGDDDQSIYSWRGAQVENIRKFEKDFCGTEMVRLEQNYRSTSTILNAANAVISRNEGRMGKTLWTEGEEGEKIKLYAAFNEVDEARFTVDCIRAWVDEGNLRSEVAILYRSNAQSRSFEEALFNAAVPYRVYGGLRFFERAEIKDALSYLRLCLNHEDDTSFERIVNVPTRGIGNRTLDIVRQKARTSGITMWRATTTLLQEDILTVRASNALRVFLEMIDALAGQMMDLELYEQVEQVLAQSGLLEFHGNAKGEKAETRVENLKELVTAARNYYQDEEVEMDPLSAFLAHAALEAGEGQAEAWEDCVQLMSLHAAKGLEFPMVFLSGMEDGLFPSQHALNEPARLEEERRLCYVGMTRAMKQLYISYAEVRRLYGRESYTTPSRFLKEIPVEAIEEIRTRNGGFQTPWRGTGVYNNDTSAQVDTGLSLGVRVRHDKFGEGVIVNIEGKGEHTRAQVNFESAGVKWLVLSFARLTRL
ncbi:MAG TPA: DNA helicase II [Gammaproteobacteria bacterium]|nr:DNA helicase II [Gammaproteobacteria bacterium]